jgi:hypothetical protein
MDFNVLEADGHMWQEVFQTFDRAIWEAAQREASF